MGDNKKVGRLVGLKWASLKVATVLTLIASAALLLSASAARWGQACGFGDYENLSCLRVQDHAYDYIAPSAPWIPIGGSAVTAGFGLIALGVGTGLTALVMLGRRPIGALEWNICGLLILAPVLVGLSGVISGASGEVVPFIGTGVGLLGWALGSPICLVILGWLTRERPGFRVRTTALIALALCTPIPQLVLSFVGYQSHDTAPWTDGYIAITCLLAAGALLVHPVRARSGTGQSHQQNQSVYLPKSLR